MRHLNHLVTKSKSGKSIMLTVKIDDMYGKQTVNFSTLKGWRMLLAEKYLLGESGDWTDGVARKFVAMKVIGGAKDEFEGTKFLSIVKNHSAFEIHFWASKFMSQNGATKAWKVLYG